MRGDEDDHLLRQQARQEDFQIFEETSEAPQGSAGQETAAENREDNRQEMASSERQKISPKTELGDPLSEDSPSKTAEFRIDQINTSSTSIEFSPNQSPEKVPEQDAQEDSLREQAREQLRTELLEEIQENENLLKAPKSELPSEQLPTGEE